LLVFAHGPGITRFLCYLKQLGTLVKRALAEDFTLDWLVGDIREFKASGIIREFKASGIIRETFLIIWVVLAAIFLT
jgi:hypothetical protein